MDENEELRRRTREAHEDLARLHSIYPEGHPVRVAFGRYLRAMVEVAQAAHDLKLEFFLHNPFGEQPA
jgi:hypothetical protein